MPVSIHRTTASIHFQTTASSLWATTLSIQSSMDLSPWMLKGPIPTSGLNSKRIPFPQNTSTISQTPSGPSSWWFTMPLQMHLCSKLWQSPTTCSPVLAQPSLAGHFGQTKTLHQVCMQYYWSGLPVYIKDYCRLCTTCSRTKPVCHNPRDFSSNFQFLRSLGFHIHGFHREAPSIFQLHLNPSHCWSFSQSSHSSSRLMIPSRHSTCTTLHSTCLFQAWCPKPHHFWSWYGINIPLLLVPRNCIGHEASLHFQISSWRWWTNRMN